MRLIDADVLLDNIRRDSKKAIDEGDKVGSFWLGYAAGSVIAQPTIQPEVLACGNGELVAQPESQWIPVSERLPEVHESGNSVSGIYMQSNPVLVYGTCEYEDNAQFHVVTYCDDLDGNTYWSTELDAITVSGVIAWMPLPEPYKPNK